MEYTLTVISGGTERRAAADPGQSLLAALRGAGFREPESPCGGHGTCGKCLAGVTGRLIPLNGGAARDVRDEALRLCRYRPAGDCRITLGAPRGMDVVTAGAGDIPGGGQGLGFAADVGTTTAAAYLYDLQSGKKLAGAGERSAQRAFGADVISRITACREPGALEAMGRAIREQLSAMAAGLCRRTGYSAADIKTAAVAGNTVMEHLLAGLDPTGIGVSPFTPQSLFGTEMPAAALFTGFAPDCRVYFCPALAGYVGGDITAGLAATGADAVTGLRLYMDIGTNGEMGLGDKNGFLCCATAAGPAFEGAQIACGMPGAPGAVDRVDAADGGLRVHVIGGGEASGVCGSGLIDAAAAMLSLGVVTGAGRLLPPEAAPPSVRDRLRRGDDGAMRFYLAPAVYIGAADIRELQLAKAAIRAGAETLLSLRGKTASDVTELVIAGGFGSFLRTDSALRLGLLPDVPPARIRHAGNAAGAGAALALTAAGREAMERFAAKCEYHELSRSALFQENFVGCMAFDEEED